jgi:hypothetical protein
VAFDMLYPKPLKVAAISAKWRGETGNAFKG